MIPDVLFALGLLLTPASQLRLAGFPVGPGEICLLIWIVLILGREAARLGQPLTPALSRLLIFWSIFTIAQSLGTLTARLIGDQHDPEWFMHDVMAYPLLAAVSCLSLIDPDAGTRLRRVGWLLCALGTPVVAAQLAHLWGLFDIPSVDPLWWDQFRGWSSNPHQLAVLCMVLGILSLHLAETATGLGTKIAALACAIVPVYAGRLTGSDSFTLILVAAGPIFIAFKFRTWLVSRAPRVSFRSAFAWMIVLALPVIVISVVPLAYSIAVEAQGLANSMARENPEETEEKTSLRFELWGQAIRRGVESGMLGLGPGPHLEIPHSIVSQRNMDTAQPEFVEHPTPSFAPNFEAHNTFLDLFTQGGLIIVLSFIWIVATAFWFAYRTGQAGLPTLLCGLCIYSIATFILRHPIFWFVIALCLVAEPKPADLVRSVTGGKALSGILSRSPLRIGYGTSKLRTRSS
ncbi:O-antigen ligase family protein [Mesorhizobium australafricanum]|uniref:O-antigen ligase family protein n=1 Tax=Mesorhizobium australafricanum TaxID=3072311 RepID=A0ABU4X761_9HYPH|nr:O-antigen ligase family protein [Mesorhizobium sp. VK3E]MDX8443793.1 O-antigen ligase family protein [Mesorhizobium sp. VK3E]